MLPHPSARSLERLSVLVALALYLALCLALWRTARGVLPADVRVGYPLDDTYIHMAIARHTAERGVWGITPYQFSSTTSSPLWTATLAAAYAALGANEWLPLALNVALGALTVWVAYMLLRERMNAFWLGATLVGLVFFVPLPILSVVGMEHTLHALLSLATLYLAAELLAAEKISTRRLGKLMALVALTNVARYEGLFLTAAIVALFGVSAVRKRSWERLWAAVGVGVAGASLVALYGLFSLAHGWPPLPPSVFLKGQSPEQLSWLERLVPFARFTNVPEAPLLPPLLALFVACVALYIREIVIKRATPRVHYLVLLFVLTVFLHLELANLGSFFRYEGYLIGVGVMIVGELLARPQSSPNKTPTSPFKHNRKARFGAVFLGTLVVSTLAVRTLNIFDLYPKAVRNIHQQQYQMGLLVRAFYNERAVAANDIGAISYLADVRLLDLYGLGTLSVAYARHQGTLDRATIAQVVEDSGVEMVVIYRSWFEGAIPESWVSVGTWQIQDNVICGGDTVEFFAPSAEKVPELVAALRAFSARLPKDVAESGLYTNALGAQGAAPHLAQATHTP